MFSTIYEKNKNTNFKNSEIIYIVIIIIVDSHKNVKQQLSPI